MFSLVDGKKTLAEILTLAQKKDKTTSLEDIKSLFKNFVFAEIVYLGEPKSKTPLLKKKPTHLSVWFHITNQYNLRCTYCYVSKTSDKMSDETVCKAIKKFSICKKTQI